MLATLEGFVLLFETRGAMVMRLLCAATHRETEAGRARTAAEQQPNDTSHLDRVDGDTRSSLSNYLEGLSETLAQDQPIE